MGRGLDEVSNQHMSRPLIIASLLGASIGVPYFAARPTSGDRAAGKAAPPTAAASPALTTPAIPAPPAATGSAPTSSVPLDGPRFNSVEQFLRFDITKDWVLRHWNRKSTGPTDVGLFSVRVPLVMGTQLSSLAGSLTYYFNTYGQVEHISFRGRTGDASQLVSFLMRTYELQRVDTSAGEHVYQVTKRGRIQSELRTRPEAVLTSAAPHSSVVVELELARPGSRRYLPPRGPQLAIPQAAAPPPVASPEGDGGSGAVSSYLDKVRYATPQEEGQVLWKRWPN
jgi:hypothetical protein